jgi:hypothetical protein
MRITDYYALRLRECQKCPEKDFKGSCAQCGCFVRAKALLSNARCPLGKWDLISTEEVDELPPTSK